MMTDDELLADVRSSEGYETARGPEEIGGRKFLRIAETLMRPSFPIAAPESGGAVGLVESG